MTAIRKLETQFVETQIDEEVVLMRLSDGDFFSLEGTGRAIWQAIDGARTPEEIALHLAERFDAPVEAIRADADRFIAALTEAGFIAA